MSHNKKSSAILAHQAEKKIIPNCTHPSSPFPLGSTDLGSAQSSLVVPFWLAHNLEIEAYKQKLLSETCPLYDTKQSSLSTEHLFSSPASLLYFLLPSSCSPASTHLKIKEEQALLMKKKKKNTSPLMLEG